MDSRKNVSNSTIINDYFVCSSQSPSSGRSGIPIIVLDEDDLANNISESEDLARGVSSTISQTTSEDIENVVISDSEETISESVACTITAMNSRTGKNSDGKLTKHKLQSALEIVVICPCTPEHSRAINFKQTNLNSDSNSSTTHAKSNKNRTAGQSAREVAEVAHQSGTCRTINSAEIQSKRKLPKTDKGLMARPDSTTGNDNDIFCSNSFPSSSFVEPQGHTDEQFVRPSKRQKTEHGKLLNSTLTTAAITTVVNDGNCYNRAPLWKGSKNVSANNKKKKRKSKSLANKRNISGKPTDIKNITVCFTDDSRKVIQEVLQRDEIPNLHLSQDELDSNSNGKRSLKSNSTTSGTSNTPESNVRVQLTSLSEIRITRSAEKPETPTSKMALLLDSNPEDDSIVLIENAPLGSLDNPITVSDTPIMDSTTQTSMISITAATPKSVTTSQTTENSMAVASPRSIPSQMSQRPGRSLAIPAIPMSQPFFPSSVFTQDLANLLRCAAIPTLNLQSPIVNQPSGLLLTVPNVQMFRPSIGFSVPQAVPIIRSRQHQQRQNVCSFMESIMRPPNTLGRSFRPIAIDGSNVAYSHGKERTFSCKGIRICIDYFSKRGHTTIKAFVPQFRRRKSPEVTDQNILEELGRKQVVVFTPSREICGSTIASYDDRFILEYASQTGAVIVSNDNFRDLMDENPFWRQIIIARLLMYTFADDVFMVPQDPLGRQGPTLDHFLRF